MQPGGGDHVLQGGQKDGRMVEIARSDDQMGEGGQRDAQMMDGWAKKQT